MGALGTAFIACMVLGLMLSLMQCHDIMVDHDMARGCVCGGMAESLYHIGYRCCAACEDAGMEFVKYEYDTGMFHADVDDCHCRVNDTYVQIW